MRKVDFIVLVLLLLCLYSCTGDKIPSGIEFGSAPARSLNTGTTSLSFGAEDNLETTMNVECENVSWSFANVPDWLSLSPSSGRTSASVTIRAQANTTVESRSATIQLRSTDTNFSYTNDITVTQSAGSPKITVDKTTLAFVDYFSSENVSVSANVEWTAECSDSWVTATKINSTELYVSVSDNYSAERNSTISLKQQGKSETLATISVRQTADANPTETFHVNGVSFKMIRVKGGTFIMGATSEQGSDAGSFELPTHFVTLDTYFIGETEVTQELWEAVMGYNPSYFIDPMRPVENVTWYECQNFIEELNEKTRQEFRLPTEAEWEYAARGGNKSLGYKYAGSNNIDEVAWYSVNSSDVGSSSPDYGTHNVGTKKANELGLYDMSGNVWEWCQDWYGSYSSNSQTNPTGPFTGTNRVFRGGSWGSWFRNGGACRVSGRGGDAPGDSSIGLGLRLAL